MIMSRKHYIALAEISLLKFPWPLFTSLEGSWSCWMDPSTWLSVSQGGRGGQTDSCTSKSALATDLILKWRFFTFSSVQPGWAFGPLLVIWHEATHPLNKVIQTNFFLKYLQYQIVLLITVTIHHFWNEIKPVLQTSVPIKHLERS